MEKTDFFGVSGAVKFDKLGNRMSKVVVEQLRSECRWDVVKGGTRRFPGPSRWCVSSFGTFRC